MPDVNIKYRNQSISTMSASGTKTLGTEGKYCDSDIVVEYTQPPSAVIESNKNATPSESQQEIKPSTGYDALAKVTVGAVSSSYVGSAIDRRDSTDLSASGATVTAPAGYYENAATKSVPNATWKSASTVGVVPTISVDAAGLVTANCAGWTSCKPLTASGYADADTSANIQLTGVKTHQLTTLGATTYTPNKTAVQTIQAGQYLTGDQTVGMIPEEYYDMSGSLAWLGADATLFKTFTPVTKALSATDFNTWTPSTTAATVVASQTLTSEKYVAADMDKYNYITVWYMTMPISYGNNSPTQKALPLYSVGCLVQSLFRRAGSWAYILDGTMNTNVSAQTTLQSFLRYYGSTTGSMTYTWSASYGFYYAQTAPTISSTTDLDPTITPKTPTMSARCSTTYMSTANAGLIDKANTELTIEGKVYRVKADCYNMGFYRNVMAKVAALVE